MGRRQHEAREWLSPEERLLIKTIADCDLSMTATATILRRNRSTIIRRCDRIHDKTGHDPRTFWGMANLLGLKEEKK